MYKDIHQWYLAVDEAVSTTEKYEDLILKFYNNEVRPFSMIGKESKVKKKWL